MSYGEQKASPSGERWLESNVDGCTLFAVHKDGVGIEVGGRVIIRPIRTWANYPLEIDQLHETIGKLREVIFGMRKIIVDLRRRQKINKT